MLKMCPIPTTQKLMSLVDESDRGDCGENEARWASVLTKRPTGADNPSSNHISHAVNNIVSNLTKNVSNYSTQDAKKTFDQLRQAFTKAPILQYFDLKQYIWIETDASGYTIGGMLSQLTNDLG